MGLHPQWPWRQETVPVLSGHLLPTAVCCRLTRPRPHSEQGLGGDGFGKSGQAALPVAPGPGAGRKPITFFSCLLTPSSASPSASGRRKNHETPEQTQCACHLSCSPPPEAAHAGGTSPAASSRRVLASQRKQHHQPRAGKPDPVLAAGRKNL